MGGRRLGRRWGGGWGGRGSGNEVGEIGNKLDDTRGGRGRVEGTEGLGKSQSSAVGTVRVGSIAV